MHKQDDASARLFASSKTCINSVNDSRDIFLGSHPLSTLHFDITFVDRTRSQRFKLVSQLLHSTREQFLLRQERFPKFRVQDPPQNLLLSFLEKIY